MQLALIPVTGCLLLLPALAAWAQATADVAPEPVAGPGFSYALGLALIDTPTYSGGSARAQKLRPLWSVRYGRFRLSGARASGLLGAPGERRAGASLDVLDSPDWALGLGLRFDNGRKAGDDPALAGLPDIQRTLRLRLGASHQLGAGFSTSLAVSSDVMGRGGGRLLGLGLGYGWAPWPGARATASVGATWADGRHLQTYFGITPDVALRSGRAPYRPGAGLLDMNAGLRLEVPLRGRWTLNASLALTQLQGGAAASPLARQATAATALLSLAWRSR